MNTVIISRSALAGTLFFSAIADAKAKEIPICVFFPQALLEIMLVVFRLKPAAQLVSAAAAFICLFIVSRLTRGAIGEGDAFAGGSLFLGEAAEAAFAALISAFLLSALVSGILLTSGKADRKTTIAFVPFLAIAYCGILAWQIFG